MTLCYNCFKEKTEGEEPCPHCGFDLSENVKKYPVALRAGTLLNGRYLIGRVLGQGGFGITYVAYDQNLGSRVAVKEYMPGEMAARPDGKTVSPMAGNREEEFRYGRERFQEEARTLAKFTGQPGIAGATDYFDENGTSYFVMEYVEGISFKTYIANQGGKVSVEEALDVMIPVLRALTAVHAEGFIHRDVTPDNIYITKDGNVKLLDFGSARYSLGDKSKSLDVILKVGYAPKEQYTRRGRQGPYTDVYSCAACLYAAITGFLPPESLDRLEKDELVPPSRQGIEIPLYLERAILKGLAVQPEDRFQTAGEFLEALESQTVVGLPGERSQGRGESGEKAPQPEQKKKGSKAPIFGGIVVAAVGAAFLAGSLLGGSSPDTQEAGRSGAEGETLQGENPETQAADLAPEVNIGGQKYSTALTELDLRNQGLTDADILPLAEMTNLKELQLDGNQITDLTPLAGLIQLEILHLGGDERGNESLQDLSPLSGLNNLKELYLPASSLNDLSPLSGLSGLERLALRGGENRTSGVTDLSPLAGLTQMRDLYLVISTLDSLDFVSNMTKLESLRIHTAGESSLQDLSPLSGLTSLKQLDLPATAGDGCIDLSPIASLTSMEEFQFGCNVPSLEPLRGLTSLTSLVLNDKPGRAEGQFTSLEPLSGLENLTTLTIRASGVTDLSPLSGLQKLQFLTLHTPAVTDLSPLSGLQGLMNLSVDGEHVTDLSPVEHVPNVNRG